MKQAIRALLASAAVFLAQSAMAIPLGTVDVEADIGGQKLLFPVALDLNIETVPSGFEMLVVADMNLRNLQNSIDSIAKNFPMPNDNCPGYGQHVLPTVESVSLDGVGNQMVLNAKVKAVVWDCQKGVPLGGTTVRWETKCIKVFGKKICTDVPVKVEPLPGPDIKNILIREGFVGKASLALVTKDKQSIEIVPSNVNVEPRGDLLKFLNTILGLFTDNLSDMAQKEMKKVVDAGVLKQTLPKEFLSYNPELKNAGFVTAQDGSVTAHIEFSALLSKEQLAEMIKQSVGKKETAP